MASAIIRIIWFLLVGWWLGLIWLSFGVISALTIVGFPLGIAMILTTWRVMTLKKDTVVVVQNKLE